MNKETPKLAVDVIVFMPGSSGIVLIKRKYPPLGYAIPGGFVDVGETIDTAAVREMKEELNLDVKLMKRLGIYDNPERDPRMHVVSVAYLAVPEDLNAFPVAGDDAKEAEIWPLDKPLPTLVCDHAKIIEDHREEIEELNCQFIVAAHNLKKKSQEAEDLRKEHLEE